MGDRIWDAPSHLDPQPPHPIMPSPYPALYSNPIPLFRRNSLTQINLALHQIFTQVQVDPLQLLALTLG